MKRALTLLGLVFMASCTKTDLVISPQPANEVCFDCTTLQQHYKDSIDYPTQLGSTLRNPYLLDNMSLAYEHVYQRKPPKLGVTHVYIRLRPVNFYEVDALERSNIDVFDYPLDRDLISEGDYYPVQNSQEESIPEFYTVVAAGAELPLQIKKDTLAVMHIPDNDVRWENEALRLTGNLLDGDNLGPKSIGYVDATGQENFDHGNISGSIYVRKTLLTDNSLAPVSGIKVTIRRLFKVETLKTNEDGYFQVRKYFRNKYTILVKFNGNYAKISRSKPRRIFGQFFPIKINFGKWDHLHTGHRFIVENPMVTGTVATSHWCAATTFNAIRQYSFLCGKYGISAPPLSLHVMLSASRNANHGNTYMMQKILEAEQTEVVTAEVLLLSVFSVFNPVTAAGVFALNQLIRIRAPDIVYGYGGDAFYLSTDKYTELVMHELAHASHFRNVGTSWWIKFGIAEARNIGPGPYGQCCTKDAAIIALGEAWAYTIGHLFTDQLYNLQSTSFPEQGWIDEYRNTVVFQNTGQFSSHIYFLEAFNPRRSEDPACWIPKGLLYDMMDGNIEVFSTSRIIDNVAGFTAAQFNSTLVASCDNLPEFREALIRKYGQSQQQAVRKLFAQYGY